MSMVLWRNLVRWFGWFALVVFASLLIVRFVPGAAAVGAKAVKLGLLGSAISVCISWLTQFALAPRWDVERAVKELTAQLKKDYAKRLRSVHRPAPLPVHWAACSASGRPLDRDRTDDIRSLLGADPGRGRLVVLGEEGAGKSVLAVQLAADLLEDDSVTRLPMILEVTAWNPRTPLAEWIGDELAERYPPLRKKIVQALDGGRPTLAQAVAGAGLLLPILDGFDTLPAKARRKALDHLNDLGTLEPVVLVSRTKEYTVTVDGGRGLHGAPVVTLLPLNPADVGAYLVQHTDSPAERWSGVVADLARGRKGLLADSLGTPAMAWLVHRAYSDRHSTPGELLTLRGVAERGTVRNHLLDRLVDEMAGGGRWPLSRVRHTLQVLARHAAAEGDRINWWRMATLTPDNFVPRAGRWSVTAMFVVAVMIIMAIVSGPVGAVVGTLVFAAGAGLFHLVSHRWRWRQPGPSTLSLPALRTPEWAASLHRIGAVAVVTGLSVGTLCLVATRSWPSVWPVLVLTLALGQALTAPRDLEQATSPRAVLAADRMLALVRGLLAGPPGGVLVGLLYLALGGTSAAMVMAGTCCLVGFFVGASGTAWCQFAIARVWLATHGVLPWRIMTFLDDAQRWGILRPVGASYEFRYLALQRRLTANAVGTDRNGARLPAAAS